MIHLGLGTPLLADPDQANGYAHAELDSRIGGSHVMTDEEHLSRSLALRGDLTSQAWTAVALVISRVD